MNRPRTFLYAQGANPGEWNDPPTPPPSPTPTPSLSSSSSSSPSPMPSSSATSARTVPNRRIAHTPTVRPEQAPAASRPAPTPVPLATTTKIVRETPARKIILKIINWNVQEVCENGHRSYGHTREAGLLSTADWDIERCKLVKNLALRQLHSELKPNPQVKTDFKLASAPQKIVIAGTNESYLECKCMLTIPANSNLWRLRAATVVVVSLFNHGQWEKFFGYITDYTRSSRNLQFTMSVSIQHIDELKQASRVQIGESCHIQKLVDSYKAIKMAMNSRLVSGIANPRRFVPNRQTRRDWMNPANFYENVLNAYNNNTGIGFMTFFNGTRGMTKAKLIELVKKLHPTDENNNQKISILITGLTVAHVAPTLFENGISKVRAPSCKYPEFFDTTSGSTNFIRFNKRHTEPSYWHSVGFKRALNSADIVLATIDELPKLKEFRDKFDVILMSDAPEITELRTLPALAFDPCSMILFGNGRRSPGDRSGLLEKRTIFHRFQSFARQRTPPRRRYTNRRI